MEQYLARRLANGKKPSRRQDSACHSTIAAVRLLNQSLGLFDRCEAPLHASRDFHWTFHIWRTYFARTPSSGATMTAQYNEAQRLDALTRLRLLDTPPSETFDRITRTASKLFELPIAAVSLTDSDRQWFKSRIGVQHDSIPRDKAPCAEVAETASVVVVPDLMEHPRYSTSPLAEQGIRFYAGAPLITRDGHGLGALCVLGVKPRAVLKSELTALKDMAEMVMAQIELQHAFGRIDPVSGLPNRLQFFEDLMDLARDHNNTQHIAVLVDLARDEQISSGTRVMGAGYIDDIVRVAARLVREALGSSRTAYHVGATQFAFLAPPDVDPSEYQTRLQDFLDRIAKGSTGSFLKTASIGLAPFRPRETEPLAILRMAHSAALEARRSLNAVRKYSPEEDQVHVRRFAILKDFGVALHEGGNQFHLLFQPRIDMNTGDCSGAEALMRWSHPQLGPVPPSEFIPIVEQTTLARETSDWVLKSAIRQLGYWHASGRQLTLSVNLSATNLEESDLVQRVQLLLLKHRVRPQFLELELTESAVMRDGERAMWQLSALRSTGIRLAIDDFGTGHSSLSYLQRLPIDVVKIDRSFIKELGTGRKPKSLVNSMITLSHELGYRVVGEGVETADVAELLRELGCDEAQGYLFAKPMGPAEFERWLSTPKGISHRIAS
ncbi:Putative Diguanylate cyclase/phosphodiesterase with GAF domain [Bradyrhizobium sp. ORS 285]|nr:Putative Diguanylate cyclase/phosphodiesterase with GAF domain [Bradyrhizobium sp. ORS 285]